MVPRTRSRRARGGGGEPGTLVATGGEAIQALLLLQGKMHTPGNASLNKRQA